MSHLVVMVKIRNFVWLMFLFIFSYNVVSQRGHHKYQNDSSKLYIFLNTFVVLKL